MEPKISVVVPVFNRADLLPRTLDSVLSQTCADFECIVTDNHSTDATLEIAHDYAKRDPRIRVLTSNQNVGPVKNWLKGVEAARSPIVKILFSDDWMEPGCLAEAVSAFDKFPDIGFVYFNAKLEGDTKVNRKRQSGIESGFSFIWRSLVSHRDVPVSPTAAAFRRKDIIQTLSSCIETPIHFDYLGTGVGYDQAVYLQAAKRYGTVYYSHNLQVHYGYNKSSITVSTNSAKPGYLMRGYLFAQLAFLASNTEPIDVVRRFMKAAVWSHLLKLRLRYWRVQFTLNR